MSDDLIFLLVFGIPIVLFNAIGIIAMFRGHYYYEDEKEVNLYPHSARARQIEELRKSGRYDTYIPKKERQKFYDKYGYLPYGHGEDQVTKYNYPNVKPIQSQQLPILTKQKIYNYMTHRYTDQKDITYNKAKEYVKDKKIRSLRHYSYDNSFTARSEGSNGEDYSCKLVFDNDELVDYKCTCASYKEWGSLCKHLIGMMILIEKRRQRELRNTNKNKKNQK